MSLNGGILTNCLTPIILKAIIQFIYYTMPKFPSSSIGRYTRISQVHSQYAADQNEIINLSYSRCHQEPAADSCDKCLAQFDTTEKKRISCMECDFKICAPCYQTYLLEDPPAVALPVPVLVPAHERDTCSLIHCMKCKCKWTSSFVRKHTTSRFWRKEWPAHVANLLKAKEQPRIERMRARIVMTNEYRDVFNQFVQITGRLNTLTHTLRQMPEIIPTDDEPITIPTLPIPEPADMLVVALIPELTRLYTKVNVTYSNTETVSIMKYIRSMNRLWLNFVRHHAYIQEYAEWIGSNLYSSRELDAYVRGEIDEAEFKKKLMQNHRTTAYGRDKLRVWTTICETYAELMTKLVEWVTRQRQVTNTDKLLSFNNSRMPHIRELITIANKELSKISMEHGMAYVEYFDCKFQGFTYLK